MSNEQKFEQEMHWEMESFFPCLWNSLLCFEVKTNLSPALGIRRVSVEHEKCNIKNRIQFEATDPIECYGYFGFECREQTRICQKRAIEILAREQQQEQETKMSKSIFSLIEYSSSCFYIIWSPYFAIAFIGPAS